MASDRGPGTAQGTGTRAKDEPSTQDAAPAAEESKAAPKAAEGATEVKYTGGAGVRTITKAQWKGAGVEDQETVTWDAANDYTVPAGDLSAKALDVLKRDPQLKIK